MSNYTEIHLNGWKREAVFRRYFDYTDPIFNITGDIDVTGLKSFSRSEGLSFSRCLYYHSLQVINGIEEFRLRITPDGHLVLYDQVHGGSTVPEKDGSFGFTYFRYQEGQHIKAFCDQFGRTIQKPEKKQGSLYAVSEPVLSEENTDIIRHTIVPWVSFRSVKHPRAGTYEDSIPKIAFGRYHETPDGRLLLPVSVEAHHGLMDGHHACTYINKLEERTS